MEQYTFPEFQLDAFNCPHCGTYSRQIWIYNSFGEQFGQIKLIQTNDLIVTEGLKNLENNFISISICEKCKEHMIWNNKDIVYPYKSLAPMPAPDMPKEIIDDYIEASNIFEKSPRASAALLRLSIQKLCSKVGGKGENINKDIATLVSNGLPERIQKALDIVRVIGNNAVHPGTIDLNDNPQIALSLFNLVNMIVDNMITQPKELDKLYSSLPQNLLEAIKIRDSK